MIAILFCTVILFIEEKAAIIQIFEDILPYTAWLFLVIPHITCVIDAVQRDQVKY